MLQPLQAISTQPTQSFPQVCLPKPYLQQPAPSYTGGCGSQFGEQSGNTDNLCRSLSFIFSKWLLRNPLYLKLPLHPGWSPCWWGWFPGWGKLSSYTAPSQGQMSCSDFFLALSLLFYFVLPSYVEIRLALSESLGLLAAFSRYFVRSAPHVDIFWYICGRRWAPHSSTPLFW